MGFVSGSKCHSPRPYCANNFVWALLMGRRVLHLKALLDLHTPYILGQRFICKDKLLSVASPQIFVEKLRRHHPPPPAGKARSGEIPVAGSSDDRADNERSLEAVGGDCCGVSVADP